MRNKKKRTLGDIIWKLVFMIALAVFLYCGYRLVIIFLEYKLGSDEYAALEQQYIQEDWGTVEPETKKQEVATDSSESAGSEAQGLDTEKYVPDEPETEAETETEIIEDEKGNVKVNYYPIMRNPVDFAKLQEVNEDIVGWIRVNALGISYPITQGEDNDYYLHRTFEGVENFAGCIFMEYQNNSDLTDKNTIIYGHNMKNGSMFGKLKQFKEEGVYDSNPYFWIYTPEKVYRYDIFSCAEVGVFGDTYQISFVDDEAFMKFVDNAKARSVVDGSWVEVTEEDSVVTLSTCTGNDATRFVVQGRLGKVYKAYRLD